MDGHRQAGKLHLSSSNKNKLDLSSSNKNKLHLSSSNKKYKYSMSKRKLIDSNIFESRTMFNDWKSNSRQKINWCDEDQLYKMDFSPMSRISEHKKQNISS